jgi:predicted phage-related endonuclease
MTEHWPIDQSTPEGREKWLIGRKPFVSASSGVPAIFGVHPYQTIASLHAEKMGLELPGPDPESSVIRRGHALESVAANEVALQRPEWDIVKANEMLVDRAARLSATPDSWIHGDPRGLGVLQLKTVGSYKFKREWLGDGDEPMPPLWIILQNATEVMMADAAFGAIGVLVIGDFAFDCHVIEVPRHKPTEHKIRVAVHSFWEALDAGQVPTLDYERDAEIVKLMYPAAVPGKEIDLRGDNRIMELLETRECQAGLEKEAKFRKLAAETEIREKIGDAELALVPGWRVTLKTQTNAAHFVEKSEPFRVLRTSRKEMAISSSNQRDIE